MSRVAAFLRHRGLVVGLSAALALAGRCSEPEPPARSLSGLAGMLGDSVHGVVDPQSVIWEPSQGFLRETFLGRRVLFLGAENAGAPRDVYRARVRLARNGSPIAVTDVRNLTSTPHGDDVALEAAGSRAVFATLAFGRVQAISVLETLGVRDGDRPTGVLDRALLALSALQETGSIRGVGRTDIVLDVPARAAELRLEPTRLGIDFAERGRALIFDLEQRLLRGADGGEPYGARAVPRAHGSKAPILWAVDTVRAEVGPEPIAWLERVVFGAKDSVKKTTYSLFASREDNTLRADTQNARAKVLEASSLSATADSWPPPPIPSLWKEAKPSEGKWEPVTYGFLKAMRGLAPQAGTPAPYFYRTFIRPDPERPYSQVLLIAFDMRQLELGMQAGYEDPKPTTGPPGEGRLPRDPAIYERVVATFNGAFKSTHGEYGMMVNRRVLLPPVKGGASVIVNDKHQVGLGSWPQTDAIPADVLSFRQNLDPLVEDGIANPTGRRIWGWQLEGTSVMTQRSALCVTAAGHLYYAFAPEMDGKTLGSALAQAGCAYAVHLDMNPGHCGFVYTDVRDPRAGDMTLKLAHDDMRVAADKYARWSSKDFFYVMVRDATPRDDSKIRWLPDGGTQPPPAWIPGIFSGVKTVGSLELQLVSIEPGRVDYRARAGSQEWGGSSKNAVGRGFDDSDGGRVIAAIGLGHTTDATRYGLADGADVLAALKPQYATLVLRDGVSPRIVPPGSAPPPLERGQQAVQLPALVLDGKILGRAHERGELRRRSALCVAPSGRVIFAQVHHDSSDALAAALSSVGCKDILELDRGSHHPSFFHRAGTPTQPMDGYQASALYLLARPMIPNAFRWKAEGSVPSRTVTSYDAAVPADGEKTDVFASDRNGL